MSTANDVSPTAPNEGRNPAHPTLQTTLYDLVSAVLDALEPTDADLVVPTVAHLLHTCRCRWLGTAPEIDG
jgi:hypothetical protein